MRKCWPQNPKMTKRCWTYVSLISESNESLWKRMLSMYCHTCVSGERWVYPRSDLQRFCVIAKLLGYPMSRLRKVDFSPLEVEANCSWKATEISMNRVCYQIYKSKIFTCCWLNRINNFNNIAHRVWKPWMETQH